GEALADLVADFHVVQRDRWRRGDGLADRLPLLVRLHLRQPVQMHALVPICAPHLMENVGGDLLAALNAALNGALRKSRRCRRLPNKPRSWFVADLCPNGGQSLSALGNQIRAALQVISRLRWRQ